MKCKVCGLETPPDRLLNNICRECLTRYSPEKKHFTEAEARGKVGRRVKTIVEFSGVPKGTTGRVLRADSAGWVKPASGKAAEVYDLAIEWDLPAESEALIPAISAGEPVTVFRRGGSLVDWFTKYEYQKYLTELT